MIAGLLRFLVRFLVGWVPTVSMALAADPFPANGMRPRGLTTGPQEISIPAAVASEGALVWTSFPAISGPAVLRGDRLVFPLRTDGEVPPGIGLVQFHGIGGISQLALVRIGSVPVDRKLSDEIDSGRGGRIVGTTALDLILPPATTRRIEVELDRGIRLDVEAFARRLGSGFDPFLELIDPRGRSLGSVDDTPGLGRDARGSWDIRDGGRHVLLLRDSLHAGGKDHWVHLEISIGAKRAKSRNPELRQRKTRPAKPQGLQAVKTPTGSLEGVLSTPGEVLRFPMEGAKGASRWMELRMRRLGSPGDAEVWIEDGDGRRLAGMDPSQEDDGAFGFTFASGGPHRLCVRELTGGGSPEHRFQLHWRPGRGGFGIQAEKQTLEIRPGGTAEFPLRVSRKDFDGEIVVRAEGLPEGVRMEPTTLAAKSKEGRATVKAAEDVTPGSRVAFRLVAEGKTEGNEVRETVRTRTALSKTWPGRLHPPEGWDGILNLGVVGKRDP
jgi:hypothetical protein